MAILKTLLIFALSLIPAMAHAEGSATSGADLYRRHCSSCHGLDGHGGVGVPIALPSFLSSVDDEYLFRTIRLGRPGRVMPAFSKLSDNETRSIVAHLRTWPSQQAPAPYSRSPIHGNASRGRSLYSKHCAACHGASGEGGHGTGVTMSRPRNAPILAPALNNTGFLTSASDQLIKTTLVRGRTGTPMRSFLKQGLRERDIDDIVAYVRSFEKTPLPGITPIPDSESAFMVRTSPYSLEQTLDKVKTAIGAANMRLIRVQTLDQGFVPSGTEDAGRTIIYSCDFAFLYEALKVDPRVGLFLPCRVTVVRDQNKVLVMTINPKWLSHIFNNAELNRMCEQMHQVYESVLEEVTL